MLANHWFRDVSDALSQPMSFQSQAPLEPRGKPSGPFTKPHSRFGSRRERIYRSARADRIRLGLKSEPCFLVHCERRVIYTVSLTLFPQIFTPRSLKYLYESGCFCAARKFFVGLQLQKQLSRLEGKANAIFSKRGLILFGNHFNA